MTKDNEENEKNKFENWVPLSRNVSKMEGVIHDIGKDLALIVQEKIQSDIMRGGYFVEMARMETITLEFLYDTEQEKISMLVKINDFFTRHTYLSKTDSMGRVSMHEVLDVDYIKKINDLNSDLVRYE